MSEAPRKRSFRRFVRRWLLFLGLSYLGIVVIMWSIERSLVYPLQTAADQWEEPIDPAIEEATFPSADGAAIHGWYLPRRGSSTAMIFCHGNGGNLSYLGPSMLRFRQHFGCSVLVFDYPGYGKSTGTPSEEGCYASAVAALDWLSSAKGFPAHRTLLAGDSLGGGVAIETARRRACWAVVVSKTFTTLPAAAKQRFWFLPVQWMMRNRFDNLSKVPNLNIPIFIASATNDTLTPFEMGKRLYEAANEPKQFFPLEGQDHGGKITDEFLLAVRKFLDGHPPRDP